MTDDKQVVKAPKAFAVQPSLLATKKLVTELLVFIDDNKLSVNIAGRRYLQVEAWQFAGSQLNLTAIVTELRNVSTEATPKYEATVELIHNPTGQLVSRGFAICSKAENKKKSFDEYAVASMAQTRAIGKAYRNNLAWLVKMAGFEATPAEEMSDGIKEEMTADLAKIKQDVFLKFQEKGITKAADMLEIIMKATGKNIIENADDAMLTLAELEDSEVQPS